MMLLVVGGVGNVSAYNYLNGNFNSWADNASSCLDNGPIAVYLEASVTPYEFGIDVSGSWMGPYSEADISNADISGTTTISSFSSDGNFKLTVTTSGYYVFTVDWENEKPKLTVRYPDTMVYFYNALNWENVYLHDGWWNGENGASNRGALRGINMNAGDNNIYYAYIPRASFYRITFNLD